MKKIFWLIVFLFFALFALTLNSKNPDKIEVNYYFGISYVIDLFWVIMIPFFVGALLGALFMLFSVFKQKRQVKAEHKKLVKVEKEVENLRAMPLKDEV